MNLEKLARINSIGKNNIFGNDLGSPVLKNLSDVLAQHHSPYLGYNSLCYIPQVESGSNTLLIAVGNMLYYIFNDTYKTNVNTISIKSIDGIKFEVEKHLEDKEVIHDTLVLDIILNNASLTEFPTRLEFVDVDDGLEFYEYIRSKLDILPSYPKV